MTTPSLPRRLPLTIADRSPFDPTRLRWGSVGCVALGMVVLFTGEVAGIIFGIFFILLGIATGWLTGFGGTGWYEVDPAGRYVAGTGAIIGFVFAWIFVLTWIVTGKFIQLITRNL